MQCRYARLPLTCDKRIYRQLLVSRNGNRFASFTDLCASLEFFLKAKSAVLDGEIVCLDENEHSQFNELLFRRGTPQFCAFDLLWLNGRDLRELPLIESERSRRKLNPSSCDSVLYVDHIEGEGREVVRGGLRARPGGHRGQASA